MQVFAFARTGDAEAVQAEQRPMPGAEDVTPVAGEVAVVHGRQWPAGVRAAVDIARGRITLADHEAGEHPRPLAEAKALAAGICDLGEGAEAHARRRAG